MDTQEGAMGQDARVGLPEILLVAPYRETVVTTSEVLRPREPSRQTVPSLRKKETDQVMVDVH